MVDLALSRGANRLLDVGCGTGTFLQEIAARSAGQLLQGVDADAAALAVARRKAACGNVRFTRAVSQALPFPDASFDLATSSLFFHHLTFQSKSETLREVARVLARNGELIVADWGKPSGPLTRAGFALVQLLDGPTTRDSLDGRLPRLMADSGFAGVNEVDAIDTALGTVRIWTAFRPGPRGL